MAVVMMASERQEELKEKIAKLRRATAKGDGYERVVGSGADLTDKMEKSKDEFESESDKAQQVFCAMMHCILQGLGVWKAGPGR